MNDTVSAGIPPDPRVRQALEAVGCGYEFDPYNPSLYRVIIGYAAERRSQLVMVSSQTWPWRGREWRKVWSKALDAPGPLDWGTALRLLRDSDRPPFGAWYADELESHTRAFFQASVPAVAPPEALREAIHLVAEVADDMEKALLGTDRN